jgi:Uma2 family endonuclease
VDSRRRASDHERAESRGAIVVVRTGAEMARATLERLEREGKLEEGVRYEVLHGELVVRSPPAGRHDKTVSTIVEHFDGWSSEHGGEIFTGVGLDIDDQQLTPDLLFIGPDRHGEMDADELDVDEFSVPPDLVIEVTSPGTRSMDFVEKHSLYERLGVPEYWVVDLVDNRVVVNCRGSTGAYEVSEHVSGTVTTKQAAGLALPLAELFAEG